MKLLSRSHALTPTLIRERPAGFGKQRVSGATKEIGSALTRMCMRHRSIETKMKLFTTALMDNLISPLELKIEEWKKVASQLDKDHAKEYKKARADIKKKSSDTIKLQKKVKKDLQSESTVMKVEMLRLKGVGASALPARK
ncbi:hypothetical protein ACEWY4_012892 [Coilia grayii]|uniref:IMD domain-containing protein n=1 Tax=Coilia grayii TaxID=363190 RepID=A0ABD1JUT8_9TELE